MLLVESGQNPFAAFQAVFWLPCLFIIILPLNQVRQAMFVLVIIVNVDNTFEFPLVGDLTIVISFGNASRDIETLLLVQAGLASNILRRPEADFGSVEGLVDANVDDDEALLRPEVLSLKGTSEFLHT